MSGDVEKPVRPDPEWNDPALRACDAWIRAYRSPTRKPRPNRPSLRFANHLGCCAREIAAADTPEPELVRTFSLAGAAGRCVCGKRPSYPEFEAGE